MRTMTILVVMATSILFAGTVLANEFMIYPNKGQSSEQMEQDKFQCYGWAKQQTGFDPMAPPTATAPPPAKEAQKGGVVRGGLGGALVGTAIGSFSGNAGKGAAIGAASGALVGGMRRNSQVRSEEQQQQQWEQQQVQQYSQGRNDYNRAYAACLEGRDYTVK